MSKSVHDCIIGAYHGSLPHPELYWCPDCGKRWAFFNNHLECTCGNSRYINVESLTHEQQKCLR